MGIETLDLSDIEFRNPDNIEGFSCIEDENLYFDSEKGIIDCRAILQRDSDGKYFELLYTNWGKGVLEVDDTECKEVFEKTKTVTFYE